MPQKRLGRLAIAFKSTLSLLPAARVKVLSKLLDSPTLRNCKLCTLEAPIPPVASIWIFWCGSFQTYGYFNSGVLESPRFGAMKVGLVFFFVLVAPESPSEFSCGQFNVLFQQVKCVVWFVPIWERSHHSTFSAFDE